MSIVNVTICNGCTVSVEISCTENGYKAGWEHCIGRGKSPSEAIRAVSKQIVSWLNDEIGNVPSSRKNINCFPVHAYE